VLARQVLEELARGPGARMAVVFDCDGVLVDSEPAAEEAWRRALAALGVPLTAGDFQVWVGRTDRQVAEHYAAETGVEAGALEDAAAAHLRDVLAFGLVPFPDALRCLDAVTRERVPVAVASNSPRWRLDAVLAAAGLGERFSLSVAGDEVARPKPAPDVYLAAASLLDVPPEGCVALEDSPVGIQAAVDAGMRVVAVDRGAFPPAAIGGAHRVVRGAR
jgi:mannitol-1-/sugar-/sorbitol-6-phosphatase